MHILVDQGYKSIHLQVLARGVPDDLILEDYRFLHHPELTGAEKKYLMNIASVYNVSQMKQNKQNQYRSLLRKQLKLGKSNIVHRH